MTTPDRPILVFPAATRVERERSRYVPARLVTPSAERQEYRLAPKFERLQRAYAERRMSLATDVAGTAPELVLVIEIAGTVDEFIRAVQRIPGLEWLGEMDETLDPDDDFFDPSDDAAKPISGELFLVMSDETAFSQMLSLWRRYVQDPVAPFDYGYGRWKSVFSHLKDIRPWDVDDRLTRTAVLEDWRQRVRAGQEEVRTEVELWFRRRPEAREAAVTAVSALVEADGGRLLGQAVIPEIAYHALLAELPITAVDRVLESRDSQLVRSNEVMLFRPVGQAAAPLPEEEPLSGEVSLQRSPPAGEPRVALLDGLPLENHTVLSGRLVVDDPEDWASSYPAEDRVHGTAMASLVVHGELDDQPAPADAPVYVRPILRPDIGDWRHPRVECVPEDVLAVDLIHRAVRRIFDGEGQEAPAAPSVRIVNLSVGDQALPFVRAMSPLARLIDWLAWRYPALFIVSAGNRAREIQFSAPPAALDALTETELEAETLRVLANEVHRRRLLSPAEAINALTVGAAYADASTGALSSGQRSLVEIAQLPAPTSALGLGFRRGVKPDVLFPGGRQFYRDMASDSASTTVHAVDVNRAPGQRVATPGAIPGDLTATRYSRGTSNSTALASRAAAMIYDAVITNAGALPGARSAPDSQQEVALLKALLVHGATWGDASGRIRSALASSFDTRAQREYITRLVGYGCPDTDRSLAGTDSRITVVGWGSLDRDEADEYQFPLPPCLADNDAWRRLTISLAWKTPVNPMHRAYRQVQLRVSPPSEPLAVNRVDVDWNAVARGTVQHEVLEGDRATTFTDGAALRLVVSCREDAGPVEAPVPYGLAVTLEVAPEVQLPIYEEVAARIRTAVLIAPSA